MDDVRGAGGRSSGISIAMDDGAGAEGMINRVSRSGWRPVLAGLMLALASAVSVAAAPAGHRPAAGKVSAKVLEQLGATRNPAFADVLVRFRQAPRRR